MQKLTPEKLRKLIREVVKLGPEASRLRDKLLDNVPKGFPIRPIISKSVRNKNKHKIDPYFYTKPSKKVTAEAHLNLPLNEAIKFKGKRGERRRWNKKGGLWYFGNMSRSRFLDFLEDIAKNGLIDEIKIRVKEDGTPVVVEGNHRIVSALMLAWRTIPSEIEFRRGSEEFVKNDWIRKRIKNVRRPN